MALDTEMALDYREICINCKACEWHVKRENGILLGADNIEFGWCERDRGRISSFGYSFSYFYAESMSTL